MDIHNYCVATRTSNEKAIVQAIVKLGIKRSITLEEIVEFIREEYPDVPEINIKEEYRRNKQQNEDEITYTKQ